MKKTDQPIKTEDRRNLPIFIHSEIDDMGLSMEAFRIYAHLARRAGRDNNAYPSYASIAEHCLRKNYPNASAATLRRKAIAAIKELVDAKLIEKITTTTDAGDHGNNIYHLIEVQVGGALTPPGAMTLGGGALHQVVSMTPKDTPYKDTPLDEEKPSVAAQPPTPLATQFHAHVEELKATNNRGAKLVEVYKLLYGEKTCPAFGYITKIANQIGGAGLLAARLWELAARPPNGDILAYILAEHKAKEQRKTYTNGANGKPVDWNEAFNDSDKPEYLQQMIRGGK